MTRRARPGPRSTASAPGRSSCKEFVRDQSITWEKNPNYWQKGLPYLDGIDYKIIPDATTASRS